jgi:hypothetical protein
MRPHSTSFQWPLTSVLNFKWRQWICITIRYWAGACSQAVNNGLARAPPPKPPPAHRWSWEIHKIFDSFNFYKLLFTCWQAFKWLATTHIANHKPFWKHMCLSTVRLNKNESGREQIYKPTQRWKIGKLPPSCLPPVTSWCLLCW